MAYSAKVKAKAKRLRREEQLSLDAISEKIGVSTATLSGWLRSNPIRESVLKSRRVVAGLARRKSLGEESKVHALIQGRLLTKEHKARIAEAAVVFRLALHGYSVYRAVFEKDRLDAVVDVGGRLVRIQVRWAGRKRRGVPSLSLMRSGNGQRYGVADFDYMVGYDFWTDTAFVFTRAELSENSSAVSMRPDAAERWDKLIK